MKQALPTHLGIIMDGNRRWAEEHGLPVAEGHRQGYLALRTIAKAGLRRGIKYFSAYACIARPNPMPR